MATFNTLHYGGSLTATNRLGVKPQKDADFRKQKRLETIIRLENAAMPQQAIAAMFCISIHRLRRIKESPEYLIARMKITHGIIVEHQASIEQIREQRKEMLTQLLPPALQVLANELQTAGGTLAERKLKTEIARDILDREGTFAKVSRTEIKPVENFDFEKADAASAEIMRALKAAALPTHSSETIEANIAFSNSRTLSAVDQQEALASLESAAELLEEMPVKDTVN